MFVNRETPLFSGLVTVKLHEGSLSAGPNTSSSSSFSSLLPNKCMPSLAGHFLELLFNVHFNMFVCLSAMENIFFLIKIV